MWMFYELITSIRPLDRRIGKLNVAYEDCELNRDFIILCCK